MSLNHLDNRQLCLPEEYQSRLAPVAVSPSDQDDVRAANLYAFAAHLMRHGGHRYLIDIGFDNPSGFEHTISDAQLIGIGLPKTLARARAEVYDAQLVETDFQTPFELPERWVRNSVVICHCVLETLHDPRPVLASLKKLTDSAPFVLITATDRDRSSGVGSMGPPTRPPSIREWTLSEFVRLLAKAKIMSPYAGFASGSLYAPQKQTSIVVTGQHVNWQDVPPIRACAIIACHNDVDVIMSCFNHLRDQGVDACFIDDWSTDGTWELLCQLRAAQPRSCVHIERFETRGPTDHFNSAAILRRKADLAMELDYQWFIHQDADELRHAPQPDTTLCQAIAQADTLGFNAIDHTVLNFRPTTNRYKSEKPIESQFTHFEFSKEPSLAKQVKTFKRQSQKVDLASSAGHDVSFPGRKLYPFNFQISHYPLRTTEQARNKIFTKMLPRIRRERDALGWHTHFERDAALPDQPNYIWAPSSLTAYGVNHFRSEYLIERLTRIDLN